MRVDLQATHLLPRGTGCEEAHCQQRGSSAAARTTKGRGMGKLYEGEVQHVTLALGDIRDR